MVVKIQAFFTEKHPKEDNGILLRDSWTHREVGIRT